MIPSGCGACTAFSIRFLCFVFSNLLYTYLLSTQFVCSFYSLLTLLNFNFALLSLGVANGV